VVDLILRLFFSAVCLGKKFLNVLAFDPIPTPDLCGGKFAVMDMPIDRHNMKLEIFGHLLGGHNFFGLGHHDSSGISAKVNRSI
jgi:hypothetical protein